MYEFPPKDPQDSLKYAFDWELSEGDSILSAEVTAPSGIAVEMLSISGSVVPVRISGGAPGTVYLITCRIVTVLGDTVERSAILRCHER